MTPSRPELEPSSEADPRSNQETNKIAAGETATAARDGRFSLEQRTILRGYERYADARAVATVLEAVCLSRNAVSLVAPRSATASGPGRSAAGDSSNLLLDLKVMEIAGVGSVIGAGWLAQEAQGGTSDDLIGCLVHHGISPAEAAAAVGCLQRGLSLVVARISEAEMARVEHIMKQHEPVARPVERDSPAIAAEPGAEGGYTPRDPLSSQ
jgi:hypothetical protein